MNNTPDNSQNNLIRNQELLISKRKTIRSEARNQAKWSQNESKNFKALNKDFILKRGSNSNSVDAKPSDTNKRTHINFNSDEKHLILNEETKCISKNRGDSNHIKISEETPILRKSIKIEKTIENDLDWNFATYRLPSISPSSKLPSWFIHKRNWRNWVISKQNKSVEDNRKLSNYYENKPDTCM